MVNGVVSAFGKSATTLWIAVFIAAPHIPLPNNMCRNLFMRVCSGGSSLSCCSP